MGFDFRFLIREKQFLIKIKLTRNRNFIYLIVHINSKANIFKAIRIIIAFQFSKLFKVLFLSLFTLIIPIDYNSKLDIFITIIIFLIITINR
jgi:hypothetical protein